MKAKHMRMYNTTLSIVWLVLTAVVVVQLGFEWLAH